jgi:hypothetical protein
MNPAQEANPAVKCARCGRGVPLAPGSELCRTCERLSARPFGPGAITGVFLLSLVPILCGIGLMGLGGNVSSDSMELLYKAGGVVLLVGGPTLSFYRGGTRGGLSGVLTAVLMAVLSPLIGFCLIVIDFFGIVGRGYGG